MHVKHLTRAGLLMAIVATLGACTNEKIVYKDVGRMDPLPAGAGGFLGFAKAGDNTTVCGTCHAGRQSDWMNTKHAKAWEDLQASGHANASCEGCHSVGQLGNGNASATAGYAATKDKRYENVQCESCHGAGEAHLNNPGSSNIPLATADQVADPKATNGCGACHQGTHHPFLEEWAQSPHALMPFTTDPADDPAHIVEGAGIECQGCHTGEYALRKDPNSTLSTDKIGFKAGVKTGYKEAKRDPKVSQFLRITCLVCHDPHKNGNAAQLRFPVATADTAQNLCIRCHNRRANLTAAPTNFRGPHSGEGQLVMGLNSGWRPPGMPALPTAIFGTHADPKGNPNQCATCHLAKYAINDAAGALISNTTGHTFNGFPCKDARGVPVGGSDCTLDQRSFKGCVGSGCHSSETSARSVFLNTEGRVEFLMEELKALLENTAKVPCSEFMYGKTLTVALGARYNFLLAAGHGHQVVDECSALQGGNLIRSLPDPVPSHGAVAHNPAYLEQLLRGSITAVKATYYK
jgi:predicted CXXCH cytochrome family protein